jgi:hypothetical protein
MVQKKKEQKWSTEAQSIEAHYPDQMSTYYSNRVQLFISNSDVMFDFAIVEPKLTSKIPKAIFQTRIIMSPQHATQFSKILNENMRKYEETFGPINVKPIKK